MCFFNDINNDGIGDFNGVIECMDYIVFLGVDVIWLLLFFILFMDDFGYDVFDYEDVDLMFGMFEDFDIMIKVVYVCGLKVVIDFVIFYIFD